MLGDERSCFLTSDERHVEILAVSQEEGVCRIVCGAPEINIPRQLHVGRSMPSRQIDRWVDHGWRRRPYRIDRECGQIRTALRIRHDGHYHQRNDEGDTEEAARQFALRAIQ